MPSFACFGWLFWRTPRTLKLLKVQYNAAMYYNHSSMRKVHLVKGHVVNVYWIDTAYVQNNLPTEYSKRAIFIILRKYTENFVIFHD